MAWHLREQAREGPIEWAGHSVVLESANTWATVATRWFGLGAGYARPTHVEVDGDKRLAIRDPVVSLRILVCAVVVGALGWRLVR